ncbi:Wall-associated receptor kinase-like 2 [Acorus calamus]|uniref:Wall-associated receptor kinase-like 2 n=1 Tax=Acorus calamus TaxID=4465 RepID=A0AAV9CJI5_ACOCL|nr:Wall-associated receptor kinase-like 2 [Acorus calamus]
MGFNFLPCGLKFTAMKREKILKECYLRNGGMLLQKQMFLFKGKSNPIRIFTARDLKKLTNNYTNQAEKNQANPTTFKGIPTTFKGIPTTFTFKGISTTFKGILDDREVIVKRTHQEGYVDLEGLINELAVLSSIHHKNIVKLLGCCLETEFPMLVYEFIPNGTLSEHIHLLSWKHRLRVATEIASAISYLHCGAPTPIVHRDLKSRNVMLDENGTAKVIGFSILMPIPVGKTSVGSDIIGDIGYMAPEYAVKGLFTEKSDVYSFGVILLELLTGKLPYDYDSCSLVEDVVTHVEEGRLVDVIDVSIYDEGTMDQFQAFAEVAMKCVRPESEGRPTMMEVTQELRVIRRLAP